MTGAAKRVIAGARAAKHRVHKWWWWFRLDAKSVLLRWRQRVRPYRYDEANYYNTFLVCDPPSSDAPQQTEVPRRIWCAWTGDNELSENRRRGLASIHESNLDAEVILVTPDNLADYVLPEYPLHPIYEHLSLVHRSDYVRCYLMHHYGGAYTDIKRQRGSMTEAIDLLNADPEAWVVAGPIAAMPGLVGHRETRLEREARHNFPILPCGGAFAVRAHTPLTTEWYAELHRRCDYYFEPASRNPGGVWGLWHPNVHNTRYPIHWNELQANIFEPLCLKYNDHIRLEDRFRPVLEDYR